MTRAERIAAQRARTERRLDRIERLETAEWLRSRPWAWPTAVHRFVPELWTAEVIRALREDLKLAGA